MADTQIETQQPDVQAEVALLTLTTLAATKVREIMEQREMTGYALRVFVQGGNCSGLSYGMGFENNFFPEDCFVESEGVRLVIDPGSLSYMQGSEIDYVQGPMGEGFAINNPNMVSTCNCGGHDSEGGCGCGEH